MAFKNPLSLKRYLYVLIHGGTGTPYAFQVQVHRLSAMLIGTAILFLSTTVGSLLFFRELELNRRLQEHVLDIETRDRLLQTVSTASMATTASTNLNTSPGGRSTAAARGESNAATDDFATIEAATGDRGLTSNSTTGRISELNCDCGKGRCGVKLSLITSGTGAAEGQLLIVLETEIPRIGTTAVGPGTEVRKRYYIYPGDSSRDDLDEASLSQLQRKSFRFSRVLQTSAVFHKGKLLRALAVNAYVYDKDGALVQHERKVIESESESDSDGIE